MVSLRLGHLAALTVPRTVIHYRSAVRRTLCFPLSTFELFALRAHNPSVAWAENPLRGQKRKTHHKGVFSLCANLLRVICYSSVGHDELRNV